MVIDIQDIINSVSVPALIKDDFIRQGDFLRLKNGDLQAYVGGFSVVFPVEVAGKKWAFRCWHRTLDDAIEKIKLLSAELKHANVPYLIDYDFIESGVTVGGRNYPTTRMKWIEGTTIKDYIFENRNSKTKLLDLANQFKKLVKDMHSHKFAHGDLQHGNIIVNEKGNLFLVDYDSFYCPKFAGAKDIITGLKDYQHPARHRNTILSEKVDYFSELIIYTSILGIAYKSYLAEKYNVEDSEHMLFEAKDFENIIQSAIYQDLKGLDPIFSVLLKILEIYLTKRNIDELDPFDVILEQMTKAPEIKSFTYTPSGSLYVGDKIKLSWHVDGIANCFIDGKSVKQNSCERTLSKIGNNSFTLKASNDFKEARKTLEAIAYAIPDIKLSASIVTLHKNKGEKTPVKWNVDNGHKVSLCYNGITEDVALTGSKHFSPDETTTYKLVVVGLDRKKIFEKEITIGVYSEAKVSFSADKEIVLRKRPIQLSWNAENASKVELLGFGVVHSKDSKIVSPEIDLIYTLRVSDPFGSKEYKLPIKTLPLPTFKLKADKNKINKDKSEKATISWDIQNVSNVSIDLNGNIESIKNKGSKKIAFQESTNVVFKCIALDGESSFEESLPISVFNEAKVFFNSDRKYTIPEVPIELSWDVKHSKDVELKGYGKVSPKGSKQIKIKEKSVFTLIVTDEFSTQEKKIEVKMLPLPTVKSISVPIPELNKPLNVTINVPKPDTQFKIPQINIPNVDFKIPEFPNMDDIYETVSKKTTPSLLSEIKNLFAHYLKKI